MLTKQAHEDWHGNWKFIYLFIYSFIHSFIVRSTTIQLANLHPWDATQYTSSPHIQLGEKLYQLLYYCHLTNQHNCWLQTIAIYYFSQLFGLVRWFYWCLARAHACSWLVSWELDSWTAGTAWHPLLSFHPGLLYSLVASGFQESKALKFKQWHFLLIKASHKASILLQYKSDASHLELACVPQVKGTAPNKTALTLDTSCKFGGPQATWPTGNKF